MSVEKHVHSLGRETAIVVQEIENVEWTRFARSSNRLIMKGVGYVTAKVQDCDVCWTGAFFDYEGLRG
ncbi:MAG: hypothetical protein J6Z49_10890 [Kiritimatiellae bacterium]|nr:hypothetical protein [Kiritimatiellia bacterium]